ncbi:MAG: hypothetical protein NC191_10090 [Muribaculaceae bacterium]|nr:hypothetical protein [Muribaculaceae bacterium]
MELKQQSLFDLSEYIPVVNDGKTGIKRGSYNKRKITDLNPWEIMARCYRELSNYCPLPIFNNETTTIENDGLRLWHTVYNNGSYVYYNEICQGEDFKIVEAEIIGTELMPIEWRLFLHLSLLDFLKEGFKLNDTMPYIHSLMKWYEKGFQLKDLFLYMWTMNCEVKNG